MCVCVCVCVCVCACVHACVRACVRVCVCVPQRAVRARQKASDSAQTPSHKNYLNPQLIKKGVSKLERIGGLVPQAVPDGSVGVET